MTSPISKGAAHRKHLKRYAYTDEMRYVQHLDWLEMMNKKYDQVKCEVCGLYVIFRRKSRIEERNKEK